MRAINLSVGTLIIVCIAGCTMVPDLSDATNNYPFSKEVKVDDVVQEVKCELAEAFAEEATKQNLDWMEGWGAKVDLTFQTNETGSITPSVTYAQPLQNAFFLASGPSSLNAATGAPASISAIPQSFNLGISGAYSGQAYRTETMSFSLSLKELAAWQYQLKEKTCHPVGSTDLQGNLSLKPWLSAALTPVGLGDLSLGIHPAIGGGSKAGNIQGQSLREEDKTNDPHPERTAYFRKAAQYAAEAATKSAQDAFATKRKALRSKILTPAALQKISDLADAAAGDAIQAQQALEATKDFHVAQENAVDADVSAEAAAKNAASAKILASPNPPIDSISHSLNFVVAIGGSVSPNWMLLHWKGPANVGNLGALSGIRTHTLSIALASTGASSNTEVARVLNNDSFRQSIQSP